MHLRRWSCRRAGRVSSYLGYLGHRGHLAYPASLALALAVLVLGACSAPASPPPERPSATITDELAALVIPAQDHALPRIDTALARLAERAGAGDVAAAWGRAHFLLDLFDDARFARDDRSLELLHTALGGQGDPRRGPEATDEAVAGLLRAIDQVLSLDRLHPHAQAARTVLELEAKPPTSRAELLQRTRELKAVARGGGPLADNARLRLIGLCRGSLDYAVHARWSERPRLIAYCLYPLYDSDPAPYLTVDPERWPPPPRWPDLVDELGAMADSVASSPGRLARAGAATRAALDAFVAARAADLPISPDPVALGVPAAKDALPYDFTPLVTLGDGRGRAALDNIEALSQAVAGDDRGTLAVALARTAPAALVIDAGKAALAAHADRLELLVSIEQNLRVPPGDYWAGRMPEGPIQRPAVLELALAPLANTSSERTRVWDPARAGLGLHLVVTEREWRLTAPTGQVAVIAVDGSELAAVRDALARVRAAFADEDTVVLVPGQGATVGTLVRALEALRQKDRGRALIGQIGLAAQAPAERAKLLAQRIERRARAQVEITPTALGARAPAVRRCYQDLLESKPNLAGRFRLELDASGTARIVTNPGQRPGPNRRPSPNDPALGRCVDSALAPAMKAGSIASAEVELRVQ